MAVLALLFTACQEDDNRNGGKSTLIMIPHAVTDIDGNVYDAVKIGDQVWMAENLRTTHYADGTAIPAGGDATSSDEPYYYVNPSVDAAVYGYYYNWRAAMHESESSSANPSGVQGVCPTGWHLPSDAEWTQLTDYVGSYRDCTCGGNSGNIAKALASTEGWYVCDSADWCDDCGIGLNSSANNTTYFSAVPAGFCNDSSFNDAGYNAYFWSSTQGNGYCAYYRGLYYNYAYVRRYYDGKYLGFSVRCIRDE